MECGDSHRNGTDGFQKMKILSVISCLLLFIVILSPPDLFAGSGRESAVEDLQPGNIVRITGRIRIKGNEPFSKTVLDDEAGRYYVLRGDKAEQLRQEFQLEEMILRGRVISSGDETRPAEIEVLSFKTGNG